MYHLIKTSGMRIVVITLIGLFLGMFGYSQTKTIHVFVALCDNEHQAIVPVPEKIGNGKDPHHNLYWGAGYGIRNFFKVKTKDWVFVKKLQPTKDHVLERILFKHRSLDAYLLADAYDGEKIKDCIVDYLKATNGQNSEEVIVNETTLAFGGSSQLTSYIGHDGLMDFSVKVAMKPQTLNVIDTIILACYSKEFFKPHIRKTGANPILWTTHLMAPEAYTLKSAIDGWLVGESGNAIEERAAQTYNKYQKCGIRGARNLFTTGF